MFYLSRIEHTFRVPPSLLNLPIEEAIKGELEKLFLDKVIVALVSLIYIYYFWFLKGFLIYFW